MPHSILDRTLPKASDDQRHVLGTVLADLRQVDYSEISERLQGRPTKRHIEYRDDRARQAVADSCPSAQETAATIERVDRSNVDDRYVDGDHDAVKPYCPTAPP